MLKLDLAKRSTTDIVVVMFSILISVVLIVTVVGAVIARLWRPEMDISRITESVNQMLSTIIGALVGFISGRAVGAREERRFMEENGGTKHK